MATSKHFFKLAKDLENWHKHFDPKKGEELAREARQKAIAERRAWLAKKRELDANRKAG